MVEVLAQKHSFELEFLAATSLEAARDETLTTLATADVAIVLLYQYSSAFAPLVEMAWLAGIRRRLIILAESGTELPDVIKRDAFLIHFSSRTLRSVRSTLSKAFLDYRTPGTSPRFSAPFAAGAVAPVVNLDTLEASDFENLIFELLTQLGFRRVEWQPLSDEIDAAATLTKTDPDGSEYSELWLISVRSNTRNRIRDLLSRPPRYIDELLRRPIIQLSSGSAATILVVTRDYFSSYDQRDLFERGILSKHGVTIRQRVWDRHRIERLVEAHPTLAAKYFSEEGRYQSSSRKTYEQLYRENVALSERQKATIGSLEDERARRVIAERDAVWKDVAFAAAHKLGNPIFAIETDLQSIARHASESDYVRAMIEENTTKSVEHAKSIIDQFKSLIRAQQISLRATDIRQPLESSARIARQSGVAVAMTFATEAQLVQGDAVRLGECFDELFANAMHWLDKSERLITVEVSVADDRDVEEAGLPAGPYSKVRLVDNGPGIPADSKAKIFLPFFSTYPHGAGLGLAMVDRIIRGHSGTIREVGVAGSGAAFELLLPRDTGSLVKGGR